MTEGLPRPVSSEDALRFAALNEDCANAWLDSSEPHKFRMDTGSTIRTLVAERDALASRVRELEGERDRLTLSRIDRECLRIGQEIQRAAGELPDGYEIEIEVERGAGSVYLSNPDYSKVGFHDMVDGMSHAITQALDAALTTTSGDSHG